MAPGVKSSGSTLMPPVQKIISAPAAFTLSIAATISSVLSVTISWATLFTPNSAQRSSMIGVKASLIRPSNTSEPVVTIPIVLRTNGFTLSKGLPLAIFFASSTCCSSNNNGIQRMPANLSPAFTGVLLNLVTIVSSPMLLIACKRSTSTLKRPSTSAMASILPCAIGPSCIFSPPAILYKARATSSSCKNPSSSGSITKICSLPRSSNFGISSSVITWPRRNGVSFTSPMTMRTKSCINACPTASCVLMDFIISPFII